MGKEVVIIGGGIVGLSSAYYLHKSGHQVTVIDKADISSGASFVNAGYITPSHIIPLASPGMITKGLKWMFNSSSPFYMKPRWDTDFFKWSWNFHKSSTHKKVNLAIPVIKDINILSKTLYEELRSSEDLGSFQLAKKGLLMLYKTDKAGEKEMEVADKAKFLGLEVNSLNYKELKELEPDVEIDAKGAIHYVCDAHTTPTEIMPKLLDYLKSVGVKIMTNQEVTKIKSSNRRIVSVSTKSNTYEADEVVMAAGSWSGNLAKLLDIPISLQAGKGYAINVAKPTGIRLPAVLMEAKAAVTPMKEYTRFAGTMEFSGINNIIRKERVAAIGRAAGDYYPEIRIDSHDLSNAKSGLRPVSPDGLPYIGRTKKYDNFTLATGHAMMGWSLGPATGKLVSEILNKENLSMDIAPFSPDRRF